MTNSRRFPETVDEVLMILIRDLETSAESKSVRVPAETTVRLIARLNAACARNMRAADYFPLCKDNHWS